MINIVKNKKLLAFYTKSINYLCLVENKKQQFKVEGFSKFGSYIANNNSDGPYIHLGFRAAWIMVKRSSTNGKP